MTIGHVTNTTGGSLKPPGATSEDGKSGKAKAPVQAANKNVKPDKNPEVEAPVKPVKGEKSTSRSQQPPQIDIKEVVAEINAIMESQKRNILFHVDDKSQTLIILVKKIQTGEVIRQIPSEEIMKLRERLREMRGGLMDHIA